MSANSLFHLLGKGSVLLLFFVFSTIILKAESKRDTMVNKAWRDTFRVQKAQVFDTESDGSMLYFRPKPFKFAKNVPSDIYLMGKTVFSKKNLPKLGAILAGSALLVVADQPITDAAKQFGRYINLSPERKTKTLVALKFGGMHIDAVAIPDNMNSTFYYLGESWTSMLIAGGFYGYGIIAKDYRALKTTAEITESILVLGITNQLLKRITGRQSPFRAMDGNGIPGGDWHPFPSLSRYQDDRSNYDAFPSGHMAIAMATITVMAGNYPDNRYIKPVGYSLMGLMGYSMLNNSIHWISDYPLAIAIGYTCGKIVVSRGHQLIPKIGNDKGASSALMPAYLGAGSIGLSYRATF